jgi:flagellar L-ring protein precursor FlgH
VRQSWTSARRSFAAGDIVTVYIDEYTLAAANTSNTASDRRNRDLGIDARISTGPGAATNIDADIGTDNGADSRQRGEALRQNRFQSEMSVRVVAVDPASGLLQIKGSKLVNLDKNRQEVTLTGWVRPEDVSSQNAVESSRIADAELVYTGKGDLGKPKSGILGRVLGMVWP